MNNNVYLCNKELSLYFILVEDGLSLVPETKEKNEEIFNTIAKALKNGFIPDTKTISRKLI